MIKIESIKILLQPKQFILHQSFDISELIQANSQNTRNDVLMWVSPKNNALLDEIKFGTIICANINEEQIVETCNYIIVENPRKAFSEVLEHFFKPILKYSIADSAKIAKNATIGTLVFIGENVVIEENVIIGNNSRIGHNTIIHSNTIIKQDVIIGCNCVIGGVGFGYEKDENGHYNVIHHIGNVVIEENVEIGNCTTIDRAVLGHTHLKKNVKVDNLVHIAHGVIIDENSLIIANAMVAGSTQIGKNVWVAPSSSIINKAVVEDNAVIGMGAVVVKNVTANTTVVGNPAKPLEKK